MRCSGSSISRMPPRTPLARLALGIEMPLVALAFAVDVVVVGDHRAAGELEDRVAAAGDPVAVVGVGPGHRALGLDLFGDLLNWVRYSGVCRSK